MTNPQPEESYSCCELDEGTRAEIERRIAAPLSEWRQMSMAQLAAELARPDWRMPTPEEIAAGVSPTDRLHLRAELDEDDHPGWWWATEEEIAAASLRILTEDRDLNNRLSGM